MLIMYVNNNNIIIIIKCNNIIMCNNINFFRSYDY